MLLQVVASNFRPTLALNLSQAEVARDDPVRIRAELQDDSDWGTLVVVVSDGLLSVDEAWC